MSGDPTDFMRDRHAAYQHAQSVVAELVQRVTGHTVQQITHIVRGYDSEVYRVVLQEGRNLIVRIRRYGNIQYASEVWAIEQCRAVGVPAPDVLFVGIIALADQDCEVMLQAAMPGRPLSDMLDHLSLSEQAHVWAQAGAALARIHSIPVAGFYKMRTPGVWDFPDWESIAHSATDTREDDLLQLEQAVLNHTDANLLREILAAGELENPCGQPVLLHGDFLPAHLFYNDKLQLCGVIDFGDFQGGPRIGDIVNMHMSLPQLNLAWLRAGYGEQEPFDDTFERQLLLAGASHQIGYLAHYLREGNQHEATPILRVLRESIRSWINLTR